MISKRVVLFNLLLTACSNLEATAGAPELSALSFEIIPPTRELPIGGDSRLWVAIKNNGTRSIAFAEVLRESSQQLGDQPEEGIEWMGPCLSHCDMIHALSPGSTFFAGVDVRPQHAGPQNLQVNMHIQSISVKTLDFLNEERQLTATVQVVGCAAGTCASGSATQAALTFGSLPVSFEVHAVDESMPSDELLQEPYDFFHVWASIRNESNHPVAFVPTAYGNCGGFTLCGSAHDRRMGIYKHLLLPGETYRTPLVINTPCNKDWANETLPLENLSEDSRVRTLEDESDIMLSLESVSVDTLTLLDEDVSFTKRLDTPVPRGPRIRRNSTTIANDSTNSDDGAE